MYDDMFCYIVPMGTTTAWLCSQINDVLSTFCMLLLLSGYNFYGQMTGKRDFFAFPLVNRVLSCGAGFFLYSRDRL